MRTLGVDLYHQDVYQHEPSDRTWWCRISCEFKVYDTSSKFPDYSINDHECVVFGQGSSQSEAYNDALFKFEQEKNRIKQHYGIF